MVAFLEHFKAAQNADPRPIILKQIFQDFLRGCPEAFGRSS
jgi:hypothetical protein